MISNAGPDGVRRRVHRARHHAVGEAERDHHRAEVRDVLHGLARLLERDALVRTAALVLVGEAVDEHVVVVREHGRPRDVEAEPDRPRADLDLLAEDGEVGDVAREQRGRGAEDAVVVALGQHDVLARAARPLEQAVLEHERRHDLGPRDVEQVEQRVPVDVLLEEREGGVALALRLGGEPAARLRDREGGVVGAELRADDRQPRLQPLDEPLDRARRAGSRRSARCPRSTGTSPTRAR